WGCNSRQPSHISKCLPHSASQEANCLKTGKITGNFFGVREKPRGLRLFANPMHKNRELTGNRCATAIKRNPSTAPPKKQKSRFSGTPASLGITRSTDLACHVRDKIKNTRYNVHSPQQAQKRRLLGTRFMTFSSPLVSKA